MPVKRKLVGFDFEMDFTLDPPVEGWKAAEKGYVSKDYEIRVEESALADSTSLLSYTLRKKDSAPFTFKQGRFTLNVPLVDVHKMWRPKSPRSMDVQIPWWFKEKTSAIKNIPLFLALDRSGENRCAFGFVDQRMETELSGVVKEVPCKVYTPDTYGYYLLTLKRPIDGVSIRTREFKDTIYASRSKVSWFDLMGQYSRENDKLTGFKPRNTPKGIFTPVYCPWYTYGFDVDEERLYETAKKAAEFGFGQFMALWLSPPLADAMKPLIKKYSDLPSLVVKIKKLGLRAELDLSPFWVEREEYKPYLFETSKGIWYDHEFIEGATIGYLCPQTAFAQKWIPKFALETVKKFKPDSLWFDFIDSIPLEPCVAEHEHVYQTLGEGADACLARIHQAVKAVNPEAYIVARFDHANLNNKRHFDSLCEGDPLTDWDFNRGVMGYARSFTHINVDDPIRIPRSNSILAPNETEENIAKIIGSVILSGVPYIAVDFLRTSEDKLDIIKSYLSFYNEHLEDLANGEWRPLSFDPTVTTLRIESREKAYLGFFGISPAKTHLTKAFKETYMFNGTNSEDFATTLTNQKGRYRITILDRHLKLLETREAAAKDGQLSLDIPVPEGGMTKIEKT